MQLANAAASIAAQAPGRGLWNRKWSNERFQSIFDLKKWKKQARVALVVRISRDSTGTGSLAGDAVGDSDVEASTDADVRPGFCVYKVLAGMPMPLGATATEAGVNFAVYSGGASAATLCLFTLSDLKKNVITEEIPFDALINKTGSIWHIFLEGDFMDIAYGYKFDGKFSPGDGLYFDNSRVVFDPYAKAIISRDEYGVLGPEGNCWPQMAGMVPLSSSEF